MSQVPVAAAAVLVCVLAVPPVMAEKAGPGPDTPGAVAGDPRGSGAQSRAGAPGPGSPQGEEEVCFSGCTREWELEWELGEPISAASGAFLFQMPLLDLGGPAHLRLTLRYRSDFNQAVAWLPNVGLPFAFYWEPLEVLEYRYDLGFATVQLADGDFVSFQRDGEQWVPTDHGSFNRTDNVYSARCQLHETAEYFYLMHPVQEKVHVFEKVGEWVARVSRVVDRNGEQLVFSYSGTDDLNPARIEDGRGRSLTFTYETVGNVVALVGVADQAGRQLVFTHEVAGEDNNGQWTLRSVSDAMGQVTTFHYADAPPGGTGSLCCDKIRGVERPMGNVAYTQEYREEILNGFPADRVVSQTDAYANTTTVSYAEHAFQVTEDRADGARVVWEHHSHHGLPKALTDAQGNTAGVARDADSNLPTAVTNRLGDSSAIAYHQESGKLAAYTDADGHTTTYTYTARQQSYTNPANGETVSFTFHDLTGISYADGARAELVYDGRGNVVAYTDRRGEGWTLTYDESGRPLTITNPSGGVVRYTYNADGTVSTRADSDLAVESYVYDEAFRPVTLSHQDGTTVSLGWDANDNPVSLTDELGRTTLFGYDANGNLVSVSDPLGHTVTYSYDLMDRLSSRTDARGESSSFTYDGVGRLASVEDRAGNTTSFIYDPRGWLQGNVDPAGNLWSFELDAEGVPSAYVTPMGFTAQYVTSRLGMYTRVTDPLGASAELSFDAMGRLTSSSDRDGRTTLFGYDSGGLLTRVDVPAIGTATFTRDGLGEVSQIIDPGAARWKMTSTSMGRLASHTDPVGNRWSFTHDERGRVVRITNPDGSTVDRTHDEVGQLVGLAFSDGTSVDFAYDQGGRLVSTAGLQLTYDERGDVVESRDGARAFGATYDPAMGLVTMSYDGQATVTYTYDQRHLLTRVEDDLSGAWVGLEHDANGRLTRITRSNGVDTAFTYDDAGRVTAISDGSISSQQYTLDAEGNPVQVALDVPAVAVPEHGVNGFAYDAASRLSGNGYAHDAGGRQTAAPGAGLSWDVAGRLVSVQAGSSSVSLGYNGLGDLRTRVVGGESITSYHAHSIATAPVVAEESSGSFTRLYVWTPDGSLLYSVDGATAAPSFYHFDRLGSTLFLTDDAGSVTDAYAYQPYGAVLAHDGASDQPFTFVGRHGVLYEPVGGLYHMRARWYDPLTARFLSRDPMWPELRDPRLLNPYQYAFASPVHCSDPSGLSPASCMSGDECCGIPSAPPGPAIDLKEEELLAELGLGFEWTQEISGDLLGPLVVPMEGYRGDMTDPRSYNPTTGEMWTSRMTAEGWLPPVRVYGYTTSPTGDTYACCMGRCLNPFSLGGAAQQGGETVGKKAVVKQVAKRLGKQASKRVAKVLPVIGWVVTAAEVVSCHNQCEHLP